MCGIVGGISRNHLPQFLLTGLEALEYRGYDSAGIAVQDSTGLNRYRHVGRVQNLKDMVSTVAFDQAYSGIGHTRWATHGAPSTRNAHPHISSCSLLEVTVVHNGIIENHEELRGELQSLGYAFQSDTDTEVIAHLMHWHLKQGLTSVQAIRLVTARLRGMYAFVVMDTLHPYTLTATRHGAPLLLGQSNDGVYLASDVSALLSRTREVCYLEDGDVAHLSKAGLHMEDKEGLPVERPFVRSQLSAQAIGKKGYRHFMQKEIFEQPAVLAETLDALTGVYPHKGLTWSKGSGEVLQTVDHVLILACGTSYFAASIAQHWIESVAGVPCRIEIASEYRYKRTVMPKRTLVVSVSQSGETADTKAAVEFAMSQKAVAAVSICNVPESTLTRLSQLVLLTQAGAEIGVASTKAFTAQLVALYLLTLALWQAHQGHRSDVQQGLNERLAALRELPRVASKTLGLETGVQAWARELAQASSALYLGRGPLHPLAQEGALKLKEISYIHAEAYPMGELKHGPLALVDEHMPVICCVAHNELEEKALSNIREVQARNGQVFLLAEEGVNPSALGQTRTLWVPKAPHPDLAPVLFALPLQLLAYHTAVQNGTDVDKPRNLAKSVTVE